MRRLYYIYLQFSEAINIYLQFDFLMSQNNCTIKIMEQQKEVKVLYSRISRVSDGIFSWFVFMLLL